MFKRVIFPGLVGGLVVLAWTFTVNGLLGFKAAVDMKPIPEERRVYETLKQAVTAPGRYICNPPLTAEMRFPSHEPVFTVLYGGVGHGAAGRLAMIQLPLFFVAPIIAAWLLSCTSEQLLSSYPRKVAYVAAVGLLLGVSSRLTSFGIGDYPMQSALLLAGHDLVLWTLTGLALAWRVHPVAPDAR